MMLTQYKSIYEYNIVITCLGFSTATIYKLIILFQNQHIISVFGIIQIIIFHNIYHFYLISLFSHSINTSLYMNM